jgi:hypothetical protein
VLCQILNWSAATKDSKRLIVNIEVPAGQLEVGRLLLRCMYQQQPDLSSTEQATLLQLLVLADRYAVPAAVAAVGRAFKDCPAADLQWEVVCGAYSLPATCADNTAFAAIFEAAADALQHTLGDLELVFADEQKQKQQLLLGLPHAALLQLLRDERTRVASENTAAHAVLEWARDNGADNEQLQQLVSCVSCEGTTASVLLDLLVLLSTEERQQLLCPSCVAASTAECTYVYLTARPDMRTLICAKTLPTSVCLHNSYVSDAQQQDADAARSLLQASLVRVCRCSTLFILTVLLQDEGWIVAVGASALHFAAACSVEGKGLVDDTSACKVQADYPAWFMQQRSASAMQRLTINWQVPLAELKQLVEQHLQDGESDSVYSHMVTWQGRTLYICLDVITEDAASEHSAAEVELKVGCYMGLTFRSQELCKATVKLLLLKAGSTTAKDALRKSEITGYLMDSTVWGSGGVVYSAVTSSWQQVEQALRERQAVHADGCLHLAAIVTSLE